MDDWDYFLENNHSGVSLDMINYSGVRKKIKNIYIKKNGKRKEKEKKRNRFGF